MDTVGGRGFDMSGYHQPGQPATAYGGVGFGLSGVGPMGSNLGGGGMSMMGTPMGGPNMMGMSGGVGGVGGMGGGPGALGMGLSSRGMGTPAMPAAGFVVSNPSFVVDAPSNGGPVSRLVDTVSRFSLP